MLYNLISLAFLASASLAYPTTLGRPTTLNARQDTINLNISADCPEIKVRREWRDLEPALQQEYLSAVKCLTTKPATIHETKGATLYDDFAILHQDVSHLTHFVAQFLPWHRYFVHVYESAIRDCGYTGNQPYWDWTRDVGSHVAQSPIFDVVNGFGGTGINPSQSSPIAEGPFTNITVYTPNKHTLSRFLSTYVTVNGSLTQVPASVDGSMNSQSYSSQVVEGIIQNATNFDALRRPLERDPHGMVHVTVGGDMVPASSPNEPLFVLHHTQVDRIWWHWQQRNPSLALDYNGNNMQNSNVMDAAVGDLMPFEGLYGAKDVTVETVMQANAAGLCYGYAD